MRPNFNIDLDPNRPAKREFLKIKVPIQAPGAAHSVEYKSSGFDVNGGGEATKVEPFTMVREYPVQGKSEDGRFEAIKWPIGRILERS